MPESPDPFRELPTRRELREAEKSGKGSPIEWEVWRIARPEPSEQPATVSSAAGAPVILTVCTGNICRSPQAELLLRAQLEALDVKVHSAGTHALVDHGMPAEAQEITVRLGANSEHVQSHRARQLTERFVVDADLILALTRVHRTAAAELAPERVRQAFTLREFARLSAGLSDESVAAAAATGGTDRRARLQAAVQLIAERRGVKPSAPAEADDVIDPFRQSNEVYEESAAQLLPAVREVSRVISAAL